MNSISENLISIQEARAALRCIQRHGFSVEEGLETIDDFVNRVRTINLAWLLNYLIEKRLSPFQRDVIRLCCFEDISAAATAKKLEVSVRTVYAAINKSKEILKGYLEPVIMYITNLDSTELVPIFVDEALKINRAQKASGATAAQALKNARASLALDLGQCAKALNISEKDLISIEKALKSPSLKELERYSEVLGIKFRIEIEKGKGDLKWTGQ